MNRTYAAIDLKSFFASVECVERGLDPLAANLVVADPTRTEKTICLAVSPALKAFGVPGRPRLFEVVQKVNAVNRQRLLANGSKPFRDRSYFTAELAAHRDLALDYVVAPPQMAHYMQVSRKIYEIYLKYVAPSDIVAYSIDEVFIDLTGYTAMHGCTPRALTERMISDVLANTGITATAGIGTNLYLCKIAMDIEAKHIEPDRNGVRIAELDEQRYREQLWAHRPLTDFWRVGRGTAKKLEENHMFTMGDIALRSTFDEDGLYRLFGVNAELLIDHAWGRESCSIGDIKAYKPAHNSISAGQVLMEPYTNEKAGIIVREMTDALVLELVAKQLVTDRVELLINYDSENMTRPELAAYVTEQKTTVVSDFYGRRVPKPAHGFFNFSRPTSSTKEITAGMTDIFCSTVDKNLLVRRVTVVACNVIPESDIPPAAAEQLTLFEDTEEADRQQQERDALLQREKNLQRTLVDLKTKFGKNAVLKGTNYLEGATGRERNNQIGGHKAK